jgi:hypothetical protein
VGLSVITGTLILGSSGGIDGSTGKVLSLKRLEAELNAVVDRLESDWLLHGVVKKELAEQVHALLIRARSL